MNISSRVRSTPKTPLQKIDKYIEIVGSTNPRLNAMAKDSRLTLRATLSKHYRKVGVTIVNDMADLERLVAKNPDLVVLGMKLVLLDPVKSYDDSRKMWLSTYLAAHGINFTGSETDALTLEFDKHEAKQKVIDAGLQSSAYFISRMTQPVFAHNLRFPLFVKPTNRGDSKGIDEKSVVHTQAALEAKILSIHHECSSDALIEEYLPGREFSVAVIKRPGSPALLAMPVEITAPADTQGNSFLSEVVKKADSEAVWAVQDDVLKQAINTLAIGVFQALGSRDYGRIDVRLNNSGAPSFIEANLMPGLSDHGYLARCFELNEHIAYEDMITLIVGLAFEPFRGLPTDVVPASLRRGQLDEAVVTHLATTDIVV
jgi:D-alanine-D-alanine ligase